MNWKVPSLLMLQIIVPASYTHTSEHSIFFLSYIFFLGFVQDKGKTLFEEKHQINKGKEKKH